MFRYLRLSLSPLPATEGFYRRISITLHSFERVCIGFGASCVPHGERVASVKRAASRCVGTSRYTAALYAAASSTNLQTDVPSDLLPIFYNLTIELRSDSLVDLPLNCVRSDARCIKRDTYVLSHFSFSLVLVFLFSFSLSTIFRYLFFINICTIIDRFVKLKG